jgi:hypothetical protein
MAKKIAGIDEDILLIGALCVGGYLLYKYIGNAANNAAQSITDNAGGPVAQIIQQATGVGEDPGGNMELGLALKNIIPGM